MLSCDEPVSSDASCLPCLDGTPSGHSRHVNVNLSRGYGIFHQVYVLFSLLHCLLTLISSLSKMSTSTDEGSDNLSKGLPLARLTTFLCDAISSSELDKPIMSGHPRESHISANGFIVQHFRGSRPSHIPASSSNQFR